MQVHINDVKVGDIVFHDGEWRTVGKEDIKEDAFMGRTIFGDSYQLGYKLLQLKGLPKAK